jgi:hypothetical protein
MPKKNYVSGFGDKDPDAAAFLRPERDPWEASASGIGYSARYDDDTGHVRGANWDDSDDHGLVNRLPDERRDDAHEGLGSLIDDDTGMGSGNKMTGGGGPLTKGRGVGDGKPRYAPKRLAPRTNARG